MSILPLMMVLFECLKQDGLEATQILRSQLISQPVIIAMTANAMEGDEETCLAAGMNDYISKTIHFEKLMILLKKWGLSITNKVV